jgi:hypothetical protein
MEDGSGESIDRLARPMRLSVVCDRALKREAFPESDGRLVPVIGDDLILLRQKAENVVAE